MIVAEEITQFSGQVKMSLISQLIDDILRVLQQLYTYFNGTVKSTYFILPASGVFLVPLTFDLSDSEFTISSFGSSQ